MLIPSAEEGDFAAASSLSRRVNANSQLYHRLDFAHCKLIKKGEC